MVVQRRLRRGQEELKWNRKGKRRHKKRTRDDGGEKSDATGGIMRHR